MPGERYQRYHEEKAKGGIGLTMFGGSSTISPDSPASFGQIDVGGDAVIPYFDAFSKRIHAHGTALMCQITHLGRRTHWQSGDWLPVVAPSPICEPAHRSFPKQIDQPDIERIIEDFANAARRCRDGGLDGCEIMASGQLIGQFWTPLANQRDDRYGGSFDNRLRFGLEVLEQVRRCVGDDFVVGLRFSVDDMAKGGIALDEGVEIAKRYAETGFVDYLNVLVGNNWSNDGVAHTVPNMSFPGAPYLDIAARIKRETGLPVIHAGRIADLATADHAIREGLIDLVGMTRAHIADPHLVAKLRRGEEESIRSCVGANYCIDRIYGGGGALCVQNPATGREATVPQLIAPGPGPQRHVVVVGGGPGGLEAARVCAERGHRVTLFEATDALGGQVRLAARAGWRKDLIGITDWLQHQLERLGVEIRYNHFAEPDDILAESPDVVIVATGGLPNVACVTGGHLAVTSWDLLDGHVAPGRNVLVFDDNGQHQGPSTAEYLADNGAEEIEFVTPDRAAFADLGPTNAAIHYRNLYRKGVKFSANLRLMSVTPAGNLLKAVLVNEYSKIEEERIVDQVVIEHGTTAADEIYTALRGGSLNNGVTDQAAMQAATAQPIPEDRDGYMLWRVGDAVASRNIHVAIYDARRLCQNL